MASGSRAPFPAPVCLAESIGDRAVKSRVITSHTTQSRDSWWYLIQKKDGTLHVRYESERAKRGERIESEDSINDFMQKGGGARVELQALIDRMFEDAART
jgi:hypothetical protein